MQAEIQTERQKKGRTTGRHTESQKERQKNKKKDRNSIIEIDSKKFHRRERHTDQDAESGKGGSSEKSKTN